ncbi:MAG: HAD family hydrolase [Candidatus Binatia bacterium]|nr:HAD family hydrolase [Candidatus Binatia bacterium]
MRKTSALWTTYAAVLIAASLALGGWGCSATAFRSDPLASWNEGPARSAIVDLVNSTTDEASADYVEPGDRIATFDNDGTLWASHPLYAQAVFALDRVRALAPDHPEWKTQQPFQSILAGDDDAIAEFQMHDWQKVLAATHGGMSTEQFEKIVRGWLAVSRDPRFGRPYTELAYQPMLEVLQYLRENGFTTFIVSGGGQEFMRPFTEKIYGIPSHQVVGSSVVTRFEENDGKPILYRDPKIFFIDDHGGKPVGINLFIGKRPVAAFGNSGGDKEMLEWTTAGGGRRLGMLVLHDDPVREYAYGPAQGLPDTKVGAFSQELYDQAQRDGWIVISIKDDWKQVFAWED